MQVYKWLRMKTNLLMILEQIHHSSFKDIILIVNIGENNCLVLLQTLDEWVYIDLYMGLLMGHYTWAQYTPTPPRSLNYRRSGVQDWTTRKLTPPPQSELPTQRCSRLDKKRVQRANTPPQPQLATGYVEAGSKLQEGRGGQPLGEDVSKLGV